MIVDSRIPELLLDLAEAPVDTMDEWHAHDMLMQFKHRATDILKVWPPDGFVAVREIVSESTGAGAGAFPDTSEESSIRKGDEPVPVEPVVCIEGVNGFWGHSIGLTRDPAKAAPGVNLGLKCNRLPEK
jgi:hypothetical protein